jgi:hypothetical protein
MSIARKMRILGFQLGRGIGDLSREAAWLRSDDGPCQRARQGSHSRKGVLVIMSGS